MNVNRSLPPVLSNAVEGLSEGTVNVFSQLSAKMQNHRSVAFLTIAAVNGAFFAVLHPLMNALERRIGDDDLSERAKLVVLDVGVTGGVAIAFNLLLSRLTDYPLSKMALAVLAGACIGLRILFKGKFAEILDETVGEVCGLDETDHLTVEETKGLEEAQKEIETEKKKIAQAQAQLASERRKLELAKKVLEAEKQASTQKGSPDDTDPVKALLDEQRQELESAKEQFEGEKAQFAQENEQALAEVKKQQHALQLEKEHFKQQRAALGHDRELFGKDKKKLAGDRDSLDQKAVELGQLLEKIQTQQAQLNAEEAKLKDAQAALEAKESIHARDQAQLAVEKQELEKKQSEIEAARKKLEQDQKAFLQQQTVLKNEQGALALARQKLDQDQKDHNEDLEKFWEDRKEYFTNLIPPHFTYAIIKDKFRQNGYSILIQAQTNAHLQLIHDKFQVDPKFRNLCVMDRVGDFPVKPRNETDPRPTQLVLRLRGDYLETKSNLDIKALLDTLNVTETDQVDPMGYTAVYESVKK